jgi:acetyltransferase-like isoleucine patch superfamily enzyme
MSIETIMGDYSYGTIKGIGKRGNITIGKFCSIGSKVQAILVGHRTDFITTYPFQAKSDKWSTNELTGHPVFRNIIIGNDVWVGNNVTILGGSKIEDGCVIGASSVIAGSVDPYSVMAGNPAVVIRKRFNPDFIKKLLEIKWWNWKKAKIDENLYLLCSSDIESFINEHGE